MVSTACVCVCHQFLLMSSLPLCAQVREQNESRGGPLQTEAQPVKSTGGDGVVAGDRYMYVHLCRDIVARAGFVTC